MSAEPGGTSEGRVSRERIEEIRNSHRAEWEDEYTRRAIRDLLAALEDRDAALKACVEAMERAESGLKCAGELREEEDLAGAPFFADAAHVRAALALARGFTEGTR